MFHKYVCALYDRGMYANDFNGVMVADCNLKVIIRLVMSEF
jgi:hypothetical protein